MASNSVYVFVFFFLSSSSFIVVSYYYYYRRRNASCVLGRRWRYYYIFPPKTTSKEDFRSSRINPRTLLELLLLVPKYKRNARSLTFGFTAFTFLFSSPSISEICCLLGLPSFVPSQQSIISFHQFEPMCLMTYYSLIL